MSAESAVTAHAPTLQLLGTFEYRAPEGQHPLSAELPDLLLAYLALADGWVDRERLATFLRPDDEQEAAKGYLRRLIHRARQLPPARHLEVEPTRVRLTLATDAGAFRQSIARRSWADALARWKGPFLGGLRGSVDSPLRAWAAEQGDLLSRQWRNAGLGRIDALVDDGEYPAAFELARRMVECEPLDEELLATLMRTADDADQRRLALACYDDFERRVRAELTIAPMPETAALARLLRGHAASGGTTRHDPTAAAHCAPGKAQGAIEPAPLRMPLNPLLGRETEHAELDALLEDPSARLIAIVGPGGAGKTHLALSVAQAWRTRSGLETIAISCAGLSRPDAMLTLLLAALGVDAAEVDPFRQLVRAIGNRRVLFVLDNFDAVIDAAATLVDLLAEAPGARVLVTSREALNVRGEWRVPLSGLAWRDDSLALAEIPAIRLFVRLARQQGYDVSPDELPDVQRIAELADGLPLAIELAASWCVGMSVADVARELRVGSAPDSPHRDREQRHRSLRTVFDSSVARLADSERAFFAALSVFRGSFDAGAAMSVGQGGPQALIDLVAKSLIKRESAGRFRLHPLMRQFLRHGMSPEVRAAAERRHAEHFLRRLAAESRLTRGSATRDVIAPFLPDLDNIKAAWVTARNLRLDDLALLAAPRLGELVLMAEPRRVAFELFAQDPARIEMTSPLGRVGVLLHAVSAYWTCRFDEARAMLQALLAHDPAPRERAAALAYLARTDLTQGHPDGVQARLEQARALIADRPESDLYARIPIFLGEAAMDCGDATTARAYFEEALELARCGGYTRYRMVTLTRLGLLHLECGEIGPARARIEAALHMLERNGDRYMELDARRAYSSLLGALGSHAEQLDQARQAYALVECLDTPAPLPRTLICLGRALLDNGLRDDGIDALLQATDHSIGKGLMTTAWQALAELGFALGSDRHPLARRAWRSALSHPMLGIACRSRVAAALGRESAGIAATGARVEEARALRDEFASLVRETA